jgi:hypothetical protein
LGGVTELLDVLLLSLGDSVVPAVPGAVVPVAGGSTAPVLDVEPVTPGVVPVAGGIIAPVVSVLPVESGTVPVVVGGSTAPEPVTVSGVVPVMEGGAVYGCGSTAPVLLPLPPVPRPPVVGSPTGLDGSPPEVPGVPAGAPGFVWLVVDVPAELGSCACAVPRARVPAARLSQIHCWDIVSAPSPVRGRADDASA